MTLFPGQLFSINGLQTDWSRLKFIGKWRYTCFTACQYLVGVYTGAIFFSALFTPALRSALGARDTCYAREQVLRAIKEIKKYQIKQACFYFYFGESISCRKQTWNRDSMLTWLKGVTDFRSYAKGHEILCDVYYLLTHDWSDERFSKVTSLRWIFIPFCLPPEVNSCNSCF